MNCNGDSLVDFDDFAYLDGGWMKGRHGELLFWVPSHHRQELLWPRNTTVIGVPGAGLDMSHFVHGSSWHKCYKSN
ncbi:hypothetical protein B0H21DRAFT_693525 [Amylocystis lapponica]|nr:hypothetical protein B0H21DRAFT_693525 [Amylocystis lapponica]